MAGSSGKKSKKGKKVGGKQQGRKYSEEVRQKALMLIADGKSVREVSEEMQVPESTIKSWKKASLESDPQELAKLRLERKMRFAAIAGANAEKAALLIGRNLERIQSSQDELDKLIRAVGELGPEDEVTKEQAKRAVEVLNRLKDPGLRDLSVAAGTMYDKAALAEGDATVNLGGTVGVHKIEDL